jgi:hypothetical protein
MVLIESPITIQSATTSPNHFHLGCLRHHSPNAMRSISGHPSRAAAVGTCRDFVDLQMLGSLKSPKALSAWAKPTAGA